MKDPLDTLGLLEDSGISLNKALCTCVFKPGTMEELRREVLDNKSNGVIKCLHMERVQFNKAPRPAVKTNRDLLNRLRPPRMLSIH